MPLSLLLTQQLTILTEGVRKLDRWEGITDTIALVARRLRSAWLVRWYGTRVPVTGLDLRVTIANLDDLRARYGAVTAAERGAVREGPNLTEPLLGAAGTLAGALAFPVNSMVLATVVGGLTRKWWQQLVAGLAWVSGGGLFTGLLTVAAPLLALGLLAQGVGGGAADAYDVLGALAAMALPLARLRDQLSGRVPVRNPLLRALLTLGDRLAALLAQVLGAAAVVVTRIAPLVYPTVAAARATIGAVSALVPAIGLALADIRTVAGWVIDGPYAVTTVVSWVARSVRGLVGRLRLLVTSTLGAMAGIALARVGTTLRAVARYVLGAARLVQRVIVDAPFVRWLVSLGGLAAAFARWSARPGPPPAPASPPSPWRTSFPWPGSARALVTGLSHPPTLTGPTVTAPPWIGLGVVALAARAMAAGVLPSPPSPFELTAGRRAALDRFRRPPSIIGELRAVQARQGRSGPGSEDRLYLLAAVLAEVGPRLERTIELAAPCQAATVLSGIEGVLDRIDTELRRSPTPHPTAHLPEPTTVRPVIGRLVIRAPGGPGAEAELGRFVEGLRRQLDTHPYPATAPGSPADRPRGTGRLGGTGGPGGIGGTGGMGGPGGSRQRARTAAPAGAP